MASLFDSLKMDDLRDAAEKTNGACGRSRTTSDDRLSAQLLGLD